MPGFGRAISDTCDGEKKMQGGRGVMPNTFQAKMRTFMSIMKNKLFSDHFFFQAVVFCLFLSIHCLFNGLESLLQETCYHF